MKNLVRNSSEEMLDEISEMGLRDEKEVQQYLDKRLLEAINENDPKAVQQYLSAGANANVKDDTDEQPALHLAAKYGNERIVRILLDAGANANLAAFEVTALHVATSMNHPGIIQVLIDKGADVNARNDRGETPLHRLCQSHKHSDELIGLLARSGADMNARDSSGNTPAHLATRHIKWAKLSALKDGGAHLDLKNDQGQTPLFYALDFSNPIAFNGLVEAGADLSVSDHQGHTIFHAMMSPNTHRVISPDSRGSLHRMMASAIKALPTDPAEKHSILNARDQEGRTALDMMLREERFDHEKKLYKMGVHGKEDALPGLGRIDLGLIRSLIQAGAEISEMGRQIMFFQMRHHVFNREFVEASLCLDLGAPTQLTDEQERAISNAPVDNPLHVLAQKNASNSEEAIEFGRKMGGLGVDVNRKNDLGHTALSYAIINRNPGLVQVLIDHGAQVNDLDGHKRTALGWAVAFGSHNLVKLLLDAGADPNQRDEDTGRTPLHLIENNSLSKEIDPEITQSLLDAGADPHLLCKNGHTTLWYALVNRDNKANDSFLKLLNLGVKLTKEERAALNEKDIHPDSLSWIDAAIAEKELLEMVEEDSLEYEEKNNEAIETSMAKRSIMRL